MRNKSKKLLYKQQKKFLGYCPICGQEPKYIKNTNTIICNNPDCKGKIKYINGKIESTPYMRYLNERGIEIANSLFTDE